MQRLTELIPLSGNPPSAPENNGELLEKIKQEQKEAKKRFGDLIANVSKRYANLPENVRLDYISHNEEILDNVIELGIMEGLSEEELRMLELSAILHDLTKGDFIPEEYRGIKNYGLAMHGKMAALEVPNILTNERLQELNIQGDPEIIRQTVADAILRHMGPRPGFMTGILKSFKTDMETKGEEVEDYPFPNNKISFYLLAADMKSLSGTKGRNKVLSTRANVPSFIQQDIALVEEYKKYGVDLVQGEAALLSGFESAEQARDMFKGTKDLPENKKLWDWINKAIEESKGAKYTFQGSENKMSWQAVADKKTQYETALAA